MSSLEKVDGDFADESVEIREVWDSNLEEEFSLIRSIVDEYPFISMDTEFPGVPLRPVGIFRSAAEFHYCTLKSNVNHLNLIQLGLTFSNSSGRLPLFGCPPHPCVWQFNFREFDAASDVFAPESIELLRQSGRDFEKNRRLGVTAPRFAELIMSSGAVLNDSIYWIAFHCCYDFGYLLKMLTSCDLSDTQEFFNYLRLYFPNVYDIKHLMRSNNNLYGGLNKLAELLEVKRVGICHQAGWDSLLTVATFKKLNDCFLMDLKRDMLEFCMVLASIESRTNISIND